MSSGAGLILPLILPFGAYWLVWTTSFREASE